MLYRLSRICMVFTLCTISICAASVPFEDFYNLYPGLFPRNSTYGSGDTVQYQCSLTHTKTVSFTWFKDGTKISHKDGKYEFRSLNSSSGSSTVGRNQTQLLFVRNLEKSDEGMYSCEAQQVTPEMNRNLTGNDTVFLKVVDLNNPGYGDPCSDSNTICTVKNSRCFNDTFSQYKHSCRCKADFPIYYPELQTCDKGARLNEPCEESHQCAYYDFQSYCVAGICQCMLGYMEKSTDHTCAKVYHLGEECYTDGICFGHQVKCVVLSRDPPDSMEPYLGKCLDTRLTSFGIIEISTLTVLSFLGACLMFIAVYIFFDNKRKQRRIKESESRQQIFHIT